MNIERPPQNETSINKLCADELCKNTVSKPSWCNRADGSSFWSYRNYCSRCQNMKRRYGITYSDREELLNKQNRSCKICSSPIEFTGNKSSKVDKHSAVIDHCHSSGRVRGILCGSCNIMLGKAYDDLNILKAAIKYLEE